MTECQSNWGKKWLELDCHHPKIQTMADTVEKYCGRWFRNNPNPGLLVMTGESNCGKTHTAKRIAEWARNLGMKAFSEGKRWKDFPSVMYLSWPEVVDSFTEKQFGAMDDILTSGLVVLDDVGAEHDPYKASTNRLCQVLGRREKKFTVVTTNIKPESWAEQFDTRITDRLVRNSEVVDLFGIPSYAFVAQ